MSEAAPIAEMVAALARQIVDTPGEVSVEVEGEGGATVIALYVAEADMGQVIGRGGRVAVALRTVVRAAGEARGLGRVRLDIVD